MQTCVREKLSCSFSTLAHFFPLRSGHDENNSLPVGDRSKPQCIVFQASLPQEKIHRPQKDSVMIPAPDRLYRPTRRDQG